MNPDVNSQIRLAARPSEMPGPQCWELREEPVPEPAGGQFLVRTSHISIDPAMRGWMNEGASYIEPVGLGDVMRAGAVGEVVASTHPDFPLGSHVHGMFGVQRYALSDGFGVHAVDPALAPLPTYLGALGMTGMTAYFGLLEVGRLREGDTVVVSGGAGAVGSLVGQLARLRGAGKVIGIAGGGEKCAWLTGELGFDAAIDYRTEGVARALHTHAPRGLDVFFDNVGGEILDAALTRLARGARIVICGAISQYNRSEVRGPANYLSLLVNRASMTGMVVFDYADRYREAATEIAGWLRDGSLVAREQVLRGGVADFPETLLMLFRGENTGKLVLELT
jgi:NADPH-dependent curcumin reductase CurA